MENQGYPTSISINSNIEEIERVHARSIRRLYLYGEINSIDDEGGAYYSSMISGLIDTIFDYNREDMAADLSPEERDPVMLYINSPGGDLVEGFALISAMEISKTPIYTVNVGEWSSMSFLIGIAGKKRFSLPYSTFLMHEGFAISGGSVNKVQDKVDFDKRFENEVVRSHVLKYSKMKSSDYDMLKRVELYMLPKDALERGFIDEIVSDIDDIL